MATNNANAVRALTYLCMLVEIMYMVDFFAAVELVVVVLSVFN